MVDVAAGGAGIFVLVMAAQWRFASLLLMDDPDSNSLPIFRFNDLEDDVVTGRSGFPLLLRGMFASSVTV